MTKQLTIIFLLWCFANLVGWITGEIFFCCLIEFITFIGILLHAPKNKK